MGAFYNEKDEFAAAWLRELIAAGVIAPGVVDTRSIEDIEPHELDRYTQCHFFAGIGVWSYALRMAGWPDSRPAWTGSCPCQPFSSAGKGAGFSDERHLWPAWFHLIQQQRPAAVFGEQVASKDSGPWVDLVQDDLEALGYAFGAVPFPAAGVGAPHIRDRLYFVADANQVGRQRRPHAGRPHEKDAHKRPQGDRHVEPRGVLCVVGHAAGQRRGEARGTGAGPAQRIADAGPDGLLGNAGNEGLAQRVGFRGIPGGSLGADAGQAAERTGVHAGELGDSDSQRESAKRRVAQGYVAECAGGSFWANAEWLPCRDGKARPVEPGTFPLAHGAPARVGRLRAYGNALNAEAATQFVAAYLDTELD